jgi:phosphoribosylformylglycinamidine cyclo-ligase
MIVVVASENVDAVTKSLEAEGESVIVLGRMIGRAEGAAGTVYQGTLAL